MEEPKPVRKIYRNPYQENLYRSCKEKIEEYKGQINNERDRVKHLNKAGKTGAEVIIYCWAGWYSIYSKDKIWELIPSTKDKEYLFQIIKINGWILIGEIGKNYQTYYGVKSE
jgi:hypothetical protein